MTDKETHPAEQHHDIEWVPFWEGSLTPILLIAGIAIGAWVLTQILT